MKNSFFNSILYLLLLLFFSCTSDPENSVPVIETEGGNLEVIFLEVLDISCQAKDNDGDALTYLWLATAGEIIGEISSTDITWKAPATAINCTVTCVVSDGNNSSSLIFNVTVKEPVINLEWCNVSSGEFFSGINNEIKHINYDYKIMKYEITNSNYAQFLNEALSQEKIIANADSVTGNYSGDYNWDAGEYVFINLFAEECKIYYTDKFYVLEGYEEHPVIQVSWFGANAFAEHYNYRLPSGDEWEKAARGKDEYYYPWGDSLSGSNANFYNSGDPFDNGTTPVGYYDGTNHDGFQTEDSPSSCGAYDMVGNVAEWGSSATSMRELRGRSWRRSANNYINWFLGVRWPTYMAMNTGFRCAKDY